MKMYKVWILLSCLVISSLAAAINDYMNGPSRYNSGNTRYPDYSEYSEYPEYQQPPQYSNNFWRIIPWTTNPYAPEPWQPYNYFRILRQQNDISPSGYRYSYATENQIQFAEEGYVAAQDTNSEMGTNARGFYEYVGDDGLRRRVDYTADERGFLPTLTIVPATEFNPEQVIKSAPDWNFAIYDRSGGYNNNFGVFQTHTKPISAKRPEPFKSKEADVINNNLKTTNLKPTPRGSQNNAGNGPVLISQEKPHEKNNINSDNKIDSKVADVFNNVNEILSQNPTSRESEDNLMKRPEPITKETLESEDNLDSDDDTYSKAGDLFNKGTKTTTLNPNSRESEDDLYNIPKLIQEKTESGDIIGSDGEAYSKVVDVYNNEIKTTTLNPNSRESEGDLYNIPKLTGEKSKSEDIIDSENEIDSKEDEVLNYVIETTTLKPTLIETENKNKIDKPETEDNIDSDEEVLNTTLLKPTPEESEDDVELLERKFVDDAAVTSNISEGEVSLKSTDIVNDEAETPPSLKESTSSIINNKVAETKYSDSQIGDADDAIAETQPPEIIDDDLKTPPTYENDAELQSFSEESKLSSSAKADKSAEMVKDDTSKKSQDDDELQTVSDTEKASPSSSNKESSNSQPKNDPRSIDNKYSQTVEDVNKKPLQIEANSTDKPENNNIVDEVTIKNDKKETPECHDDIEADSDCDDDNL